MDPNLQLRRPGALLCSDRSQNTVQFIDPVSHWEIGYNESFNGKLRDELLNGEIFYTLKEAQILIEQWRMEYNTIRPHSSLGYKPPAPEALLFNYSKKEKEKNEPSIH